MGTVLSLSLMQSSISASQMVEQTDAVTIAGQKQLKPNSENVKFSKEQAITKLRELFPLLNQAEAENIELGNSHTYPPPPNQMVWNIQWAIKDGTSSFGFNSEVDAISGDLISTNLYTPFNEDDLAYYPPKISEKEALELAKAFLAKAVPSSTHGEWKKDEDIYMGDQPLFGPVQYHFQFIPTVNGIPISSERTSILLDGEGTVCQFNRSNAAPLGDYPTIKPKISVEEANQKYKQKVNLELLYIPIYQGRDVSWFLGWKGLAPTYSTMDAETGEFLAENGDPIPSEPLYQEVPKTDKIFSPIVGKDGSITAEQAAEVIEKHFAIPKGRELLRKSMSNNFYGNGERKVWDLSWGDPTNRFMGPQGETHAFVDSVTGQVLDYQADFSRPFGYVDSDAGGNKAGITKEEATKKAMEIINELYPNAASELKWNNFDYDSPIKSPDNQFLFRFQRYYEGIPVFGEGVSLTLDQTGTIQSFHNTPMENLAEKVKGLEPTISKEEATNKYLQDTSVQLTYRSFGGFNTTQGYVQPTIKMVYQQEFAKGLNPWYAINAVDGTWTSGWANKPEQEKAVEPEDIKGHWAYDDLKTMLEHQLLTTDEQGKVGPDQSITAGDWLKMMSKAVNPQFEHFYGESSKNVGDVSKDSPYYQAVQWAYEQKWLDPEQKKLSLDQPLTREQLAVSLTRILRYDKLAKFLNDDLITFQDENGIENKGTAFIVFRLGLIQGTNGMFEPNKEVTKAEAATVIMRLVHLQGKTDKQIYR
ncbi:MAG TPA: YcdB/YcdC domain-containing protein [Bacillota bacterium]|nr:YcdB/YcdC domain-containing protein [Bacillota bacterium]